MKINYEVILDDFISKNPKNDVKINIMHSGVD
jgi:hypothetical protein